VAYARYAADGLRAYFVLISDESQQAHAMSL
jgi:hypothetical protein